MTDNPYFEKERKVVHFSSGCTTLDLALGGPNGIGWAEGRICHVYGPESSGKTQAAEEAAINFNSTFTDSEVWYIESESAFDESYASVIGLDPAIILWPRRDKKSVKICTNTEKFDYEPANTAEDIEETIEIALAKSKKTGIHILIIIDSLDAMTCLVELEGKDAYGAGKAKAMSGLFRRTASKMSGLTVTIFVVSQTRQNVGVMFGPKKIVSSGEAMKFYASQRLELKEIKSEAIMETVRGAKYQVGIMVEATCKKNKVGIPHQSCNFGIRFNYGIDDVGSCLDFIQSIDPEYEVLNKIGLDIFTTPKKGEEDKPLKVSNVKMKKAVSALSAGEFPELKEKIKEETIRLWREIEEELKPKGRKYN